MPIETGAVTALAPLGVATTSLPSGTEGIAYAATTAATGGLVPYTWELAPASGPLPTGLAISPAGVISGTPTAAGAFQFTVQVTDSEGDTATQPLAIMVASSGGGGVDQAAAWGLPVQTSTTGAQATYAIPLAGVTSGQPILLFHMNLGGNYLGANPIVDNFVTPYNWQRITGVKQTRALEAWIGTGGAGTGGTITVTTGDSVNTTTGLAVPAQGASTAAGLGAVDVSGVASSASTVTIAMPVLLTGPAGDAVFYVCSQGSVALQTGTYINVYPFAESTGLSALFYCLASGLPNNDTCQPSWNNQTAGLYAAVGVALKAAV